MPRRKAVHLDEMMSSQHQPRSRHPHSSHIDMGYGLYAGNPGGNGLYAGNPGGNGLYAGNGVYAGYGLVRNAIDDIENLGTIIKKQDHRHHHKTLMGHKLVGLPPALQSQPYSTHYQWGVTLPPAYQRIVKGNGLY
jgi:hypothetical protein